MNSLSHTFISWEFSSPGSRAIILIAEVADLFIILADLSLAIIPCQAGYVDAKNKCLTSDERTESSFTQGRFSFDS